MPGVAWAGMRSSRSSDAFKSPRVTRSGLSLVGPWLDQSCIHPQKMSPEVSTPDPLIRVCSVLARPTLAYRRRYIAYDAKSAN